METPIAVTLTPGQCGQSKHALYVQPDKQKKGGKIHRLRDAFKLPLF